MDIILHKHSVIEMNKDHVKKAYDNSYIAGNIAWNQTLKDLLKKASGLTSKDTGQMFIGSLSEIWSLIKD